MRRWRCTPVSRNWMQTIVHIILLKKACFYNRCSNSRPCVSLHVWYRRSNDRPTMPSNRSSSSNPLLLLPPKKKSKGVKSSATYCYDRVRADGTNHICVHYSMVSWFQCVARAPWYKRISQERNVCGYLFLHKKWSSLHGLSSLSFWRWGPVTPCIISI